MPTPFEYRLRVRYAECDAQGVVFNARYGDYADLAMNEFVRALFGDYRNLLDQDLDIQVVSMTLNWQAPAHFDDVLRARVQTRKLGNTSFTIAVDFSRYPDDEAIAQGELTYVVVSPASLTKKPIPETMRHSLEQGAPGVVISHAGEDQTP
ncbi:MAG: acyl-CoA thioesterase [Pseudomonadota bacterium]